MNREIKFRGKRVNGGEWVYGMTISNGTIKRKINNIPGHMARNCFYDFKILKNK